MQLQLIALTGLHAPSDAREALSGYKFCKTRDF